MRLRLKTITLKAAFYPAAGSNRCTRQKTVQSFAEAEGIFPEFRALHTSRYTDLEAVCEWEGGHRIRLMMAGEWRHFNTKSGAFLAGLREQAARPQAAAGVIARTILATCALSDGPDEPVLQDGPAGVASDFLQMLGLTADDYTVTAETVTIRTSAFMAHVVPDLQNASAQVLAAAAKALHEVVAPPTRKKSAA